MTRPGTSLTERMDGLLFFPVTPFGADGEVDLHVYRQHLRTRLAAGPAAVFAGIRLYHAGLAGSADLDGIRDLTQTLAKGADR